VGHVDFAQAQSTFATSATREDLGSIEFKRSLIALFHILTADVRKKLEQSGEESATEDPKNGMFKIVIANGEERHELAVDANEWRLSKWTQQSNCTTTTDDHDSQQCEHESQVGR
jgi:hypothetical protein